jgi:hypothetical protein
MVVMQESVDPAVVVAMAATQAQEPGVELKEPTAEQAERAAMLGTVELVAWAVPADQSR